MTDRGDRGWPRDKSGIFLTDSGPSCSKGRDGWSVYLRLCSVAPYGTGESGQESRQSVQEATRKRPIGRESRGFVRARGRTTCLAPIGRDMCHGDLTCLLGDGAKTVFLAATAPHGDSVPDRLNELLDYVASGTASGELSERLDAEVARVLDNKKWRLEYMIQQVREQLSYERGEAAGYERGEAIDYEKGEAAGYERGEAAGLARGEAAGLERGREEGAARLSSCLASLADALRAAGREQELARAVTDSDCLRNLCAEFDIGME